MKVKNFIALSMVLGISGFVCACDAGPDNPNIDENESDPKNPETYFKVGDDYKTLPGVTLDYANGFYDSFDSFNKNNWYVGKGYWGSGNGGVSPSNVFLTDDGSLAIRGTGLHYAKKDLVGYGQLTDGRNVGGTLVSRFLTGPGRYEVKMKVLPREGACTAFWTFAYKDTEGTPLNHEIDIELPGGIKTGKVTFKKALNTNWITEQDSNSVEYAISEVDPNSESIAYNDGEWHTFGFDWYTNPSCVVYFADGKITNVSTIFVPTLETRITLGVWFPPSLVGTANFESDYVFFDYVSYDPFLDQPYDSFEASPGQVSYSDSDYNIQRIAKNSINKVSNGDFEYAGKQASTSLTDLSNRGWQFLKLNNEDKELEEVINIRSGIGTGSDDRYACEIKDGGVLRQEIDSVYDNYKYKLSFDAKSQVANGGELRLHFLGDSDSQILETKTISISGSEFSKYEQEVTAPIGSNSIRLEVRSSTGNTVVIDNISLTFIEG